MLKAIFFDAVGTLIHLARPVGEEYREIAARHGAVLDVTALNHAFRRAMAETPPRPPSEGPRPDDDKGWWRDLVAGVIGATLPAEQRAGFDEPAFFAELYAHFAAPGVWVAYPEAHAVLIRLRERGFALGVISNFDRRLYPVLDSLGLSDFFRTVIVSSEVGVEKPAPRIFQHALAALGTSPAEAMHVGDEPSDWTAEALGWRVVRLERPTMTLHAVEESLQPRPS